MAERTTSGLFTSDELWLLQSVIRHEIAQMEGWKAPPASAALNEQIAEALLFCAENNVNEAAVLLTMRDCLAIDYCVPQAAKSPAGAPIGRMVLLKSYRARAELEQHWHETAEEPVPPTHDEIVSRMERWKAQPPPAEPELLPFDEWREKRRKRTKRSA
jgi:hypothetical protein